MIDVVLVSFIAYIVGSIPFSILMTRVLTGEDVRASGSGHAGATNTMRAAGWVPGITVLILDLAKGWMAIWLADQISGVEFAPGILRACAALFVVIGHCWPVFAGFRGGMGMATSARPAIFRRQCRISIGP